MPCFEADPFVSLSHAHVFTGGVEPIEKKTKKRGVHTHGLPLRASYSSSRPNIVLPRLYRIKIAVPQRVCSQEGVQSSRMPLKY